MTVNKEIVDICGGLLSPDEITVLTAATSGTTIVLDFGAHQGLSTSFFSTRAKKVYSFESFQGLQDVSEKDAGIQNGNFTATKEQFLRNIAQFGKPEVIQLVEGDCKTTLPTLGLTTFDVAFLDLDTYESTKVVIEELRKIGNGRIFVHDSDLPGIQLALRETRYEGGFTNGILEI